MSEKEIVQRQASTAIKQLKKHVHQCLLTSSLRVLAEDYQGEAAVVMPIFERGGKAYFLLTLRTQEVSTHKGQISFPGGLRDSTDINLRETALREMEEEVGIGKSHVEVVGPFHQYLSKTHFVVTPFVTFINQGFSVSPNSREVERILEVPLDFFCCTEPRREVHKRVLYFYDYQGDIIWGLTAAMIKDFIDLLNGSYSRSVW